MQLSSPYALPYGVFYHQELESGERDITFRVVLADPVSADASSAIESTVLPFLLMSTSGALAGKTIPPWTSTIKTWSGPAVMRSTIEWSLTGVTCDVRSWVMLAQMLLSDHKTYAIQRIEVVEARRTNPMVRVLTGIEKVDPYPKRWIGIRFSIDLYNDLPTNFTVYAAFVHELTPVERENIGVEFAAWAPGLMLGAYGVAPVPPDLCTGMPDEDPVFFDNQLEWPIRNFKAHTGAIEGLINVFGSISQKIVRVTEFRVE